MGQYANAVNAYAMSAARAKVYCMQNTLQSYGQTAQQLNVSTAKFRRDIEAKKAKFIAQLEKEKIAKMQTEIVSLQAKHSVA
jgi:predicted lipase